MYEANINIVLDRFKFYLIQKYNFLLHCCSNKFTKSYSQMFILHFTRKYCFEQILVFFSYFLRVSTSSFHMINEPFTRDATLTSRPLKLLPNLHAFRVHLGH